MAGTEARDHFEDYFAEKLWAMIPEAFREEDGLATPPGVLRAFIETLGRQAAVLRRSQDRLWEDQFIELCSEWAVPYIGELVGTRMVSVHNRRGRRIDVAKTIYYRRRAGTPRVIEELAADLAGWESKLVEEFRRLGRMRHGLDPRPAALAGRFTGTPPGGWADLRNPRGAELAGGPFDEFHHTPDMRRPRGADGRHGIPKLGFHLYRLASTRLEGVEPCRIGTSNTLFTFDPSGRDIPLFIRRHRTDDRDQRSDRHLPKDKHRYNWESWQSAQEWQLPAPLNCRLLNHAEFVVTPSVLAVLRPMLTTPEHGGLSSADADNAVAGLQPFCGLRFPSESQLSMLRERLTRACADDPSKEAAWKAFMKLALVDDCGKHALLPGGGAGTSTGIDASVYLQVGAGIPPRENVAGGNLSTWSLTAKERDWIIDPERGRLLWSGTGPAPKPLVTYHYGFSGPIGAGGYDRSGSITTQASSPPISGGGAIAAIAASDVVTEITDSRTYGPVDPFTIHDRYELRAADRCRPYVKLGASWPLNGTRADSTLLLDGVWVGATGAGIAVELSGSYDTVTLRSVTLDPGGRDEKQQNVIIQPVALHVVGNVRHLVIEHAIMGPIRVTGTIHRISISDAIVDGTNGQGGVAITALAGEVSLERVTVFGDLEAEWLYASEVLIRGGATVTNTQAGCFRFSAAQAGSRVPRPFESQFPESFAGCFTSPVFGQPGYMQLSESASARLARGAENGSEIGAFSRFINPIKADSLRAKVEEYAPFGVLPFFIFET